MIDRNGLNVFSNPQIQTKPSTTKLNATELSHQFGQYLDQAIQGLKLQEKEKNELTQQFITGQISDPHKVMIAAEKSALGLEMTVQVRNKVIEAYQEIMRIQI